MAGTCLVATGAFFLRFLEGCDEFFCEMVRAIDFLVVNLQSGVQWAVRKLWHAAAQREEIMNDYN